ncbi:MAG TPA: hypothetical protein VLD65_01615 [Anaerolineales bacterium]|nr:hypothetical protein [Anaerolineales bacterium]
MNIVMEKGTSFIWQNARMLDRAIFENYFLDGSPDRILSIMRLYQNPDGGFGHALEPDLRARESQPLFIEFALRTLYDCQLHDPEIAYRACDFIASHSDLTRGIPTLLPSSQSYPRAEHMLHAGWLEPAMDRLVGLVGMLNWQGVQHPWLPGAVDVCLQHLATTIYDDSHTILTAFCLVESVSKQRSDNQLFDKLSQDLLKANFFCLEVPIKSYGLTPLIFAPSPTSYCRKIFTDDQIEAHLDELLSQQQADGGWPIMWRPPSEMANCEWRAQKTVMALATLHAYGRI